MARSRLCDACFRAPRGPAPPAAPAASAQPEAPGGGGGPEVPRHVPPVSAVSARAAVRSKTRDGAADRGDAPGEYRAAVELVKGGKHDEAVAALRAFIAHY